MKMINQTPKRHILIKLVNSNNISAALRKMNRLIKNIISALPQKNFKIKNWYNNNQCNNSGVKSGFKSATLQLYCHPSYYDMNITIFPFQNTGTGPILLKILWLHFHSRLTRKVNWLLSFYYYHHHCQNVSCSRVSLLLSLLYQFAPVICDMLLYQVLL